MLAKLFESLFPSNLPPLSKDSAQWTGDALSAKLKAMNPASAAHQRRAKEMQALIEECIANSKEGKAMGSAHAVRRADTGKLTVPTAELCLDYYAIARFLSSAQS